LNWDDLFNAIHDNKKVRFTRVIWDLEIVYTVSYIQKVQQYRIDVHVDDRIVRRQHFLTTTELEEFYLKYELGFLNPEQD
jgi:hypothetical protein